MSIRIIFTLLFIVLCNDFASAFDIKNLKFRKLKTSEGLAHSNVRWIVQDEIGFMWFGTKDGLNRYDGYSFLVYKKSLQEGQGLRSSDVKTLTIFENNNIWISNENGFLDILNIGQERFIDHPLKNIASINTIKTDKKGTAWIGTGSSGLYVYDQKQNSLKNISNDLKGNLKLTSHNISSIEIDSRNYTWVASADKGITILNGKFEVIKRYRHDPSDENSLSSDKVKFVFEDSKKRIWIGTYGGGLNRYIPEKDSFEKVSLRNHQHPNLEDPDYLICIEEDGIGNLWIGSENTGLYVINPDQQVSVNFLHSSEDDDSIADNTINCIKKDKWGNLWIGTSNGGISVTNPSTAVFTHHKYRKEKGYLSHNIVNAFFQDKNGKIWIGTDGGGLNQYDEKTGQIQTFKHITGNNNSISSNYILSMNEDTNGNLWVGTWGKGITIISLDGKYRHLRHDERDSKTLSSDYVYNIFKDSKGRMWIGTYGGGVCQYDEDKRAFKQFSYKKTDTTIFNNDYILSIHESTDGTIWFGTDGGGLNMFNEQSQQFEMELNSKNGLSNDRVVSIHSDRNGELWIATNFGLNQYNPKTKKNKIYSSVNGLPSDVITAVITDQNGKIWISSNGGISMLHDDGTFKNYTKEDGLQDNEFRNCKLLSSSGVLYFGGKNGFNTFIPNNIKPRTQNVSVKFTRFQIFNKDVLIDTTNQTNQILSKSIVLTDNVTIPYSKNVFSFDFAMLHAGVKERKIYRYKLNGFDKDWQYLGHKNSVTFTNLDPGNYELLVQGADIEGKWPNNWSQMNITITPPFYKTWWFILLEIAISITIIFIIYRYRTASIRTRNLQLKKEVESRTFELSEANAYLQESNEQIKVQNIHLEESNKEISRKTDKILEQQRRILLHKQTLEKTINELELSNQTKDKLFAIISHDLKNPILAMQGISTSLYKKYPQLDSHVIEKQIKDVYMASNSITELVFNLLDWSRVHVDNINYDPQEVNLYELVMKNIFLAQPQIKSKHIQINLNIPVGHTVIADKNMLDAIIRNILNNAIKFTHLNGQISFHSIEHENEIIFSCIDTGIGMTAEQIQLLENTNKNHINIGTFGEKGTGLGLMIIKEFLTLMNGKLKINSQLGEGTTFSISLKKSSINNTENLIFPQYEQDFNWSIANEMNTEDIDLIKGKRLLIVEDNDEVRNFINLLLSGVFEIFEAKNGEEAYQIIHEMLPDIVISDMIMPIMDGLTLSRKMKSDVQINHIPIILLTSENNTNGKLASYEAGCDVFIGKPINKDILLQVIINLLKRQEIIRKKFNDDNEVLSIDGFNQLDQEFIQKISDFINDNLSDSELDYRKICELTSMSRTVLYSKLKVLTGLGVNDFIKTIRLKKSLELFKEGRYNISQIAYEVGFSTPSYFSKSFTKQYNMSPKEYVAKLKKPKSIFG